MPRHTKRLTQAECQHAEAGEKVRILSDGDGLQLRITPHGSKRWLLNYYAPLTKKRTSITIGSFPALTPSMARDIALEKRRLVQQGIDPREQRDTSVKEQRERQQHSLKAIGGQWLEVKKTEVTPAYAEDIWRSLERHIFPKLGNAPLADLTAPMVIEVLRPIEAAGNLETIKRLCQRLNEVMDYGVNHGLIFANPLATIHKVFRKPQMEHFPALPPSQLPDLLETVAEASIKKATRYLILWQLHTLTRPSEAAATRWDEIDFDGQIWTIPAERMKKRREHIIPLSPQALAILDKMRPISGHRPYTFPSSKSPGKDHTNSQTANMALRRMGYSGELVSHGLRSIGSTVLNESGRFDADIIEVALAHVDSNDTRRAYNRALYLDRRREMMVWWSNYIQEAARASI